MAGSSTHPTERKTVQARILAYAQGIAWMYVPPSEAEKRCGFDNSQTTPAEQAAEASPYFDDLLDAAWLSIFSDTRSNFFRERFT